MGARFIKRPIIARFPSSTRATANRTGEPHMPSLSIVLTKGTRGPWPQEPEPPRRSRRRRSIRDTQDQDFIYFWVLYLFSCLLCNSRMDLMCYFLVWHYFSLRVFFPTFLLLISLGVLVPGLFLWVPDFLVLLSIDPRYGRNYLHRRGGGGRFQWGQGLVLSCLNGLWTVDWKAFVVIQAWLTIQPKGGVQLIFYTLFLLGRIFVFQVSAYTSRNNSYWIISVFQYHAWERLLTKFAHMQWKSTENGAIFYSNKNNFKRKFFDLVFLM